VISLGKIVEGANGEPLMIRRYSDSVLLALLRAHRPEKYRERASVELDISDRLADRLEAARRRAIAKPEDAAVTLDLKAVAVQSAPNGEDAGERSGDEDRD
jgi:hypothetical protein